MKTKLITGLALAAALLIGQPAYAKDKRDGGRGEDHAVAAVHHSSVGNHAIAAVHHGGGGDHAIASRHTSARSEFHATRIAHTTTANRTYAVANTGHTNRVRNSVAFGGNSHYNAGNNNGGGNHHRSYAFASHSGWNHDQEYYWHGHHYRWYGDGWYLIDLTPFAAGYYPYYNGPGYNTDSLAVQVQQDLAHDGYYEGPIDGIVGPGTSGAIAAYQRDNGLPVTGTINGPLLRSMGL